MSSLSLLNVLDVARSFGERPLAASPEQIADWLIAEYAKKRGGGFNYNPAINTLFDLFRGAANQDQAILRCMTTGNPKGRRPNVEAISCVADYAMQNVSTCYRIDPSAVVVGKIKERLVYVAIKAPMVRVQHDEAFVVLPGFRMSHRPTEAQIDLACSIVLANFGRDDFATADFEYLYAGPGISGERQFRSILGKERTVYDIDQIDALLDVYVKGVEIALQAGVGQDQPNLRGYRIIDPQQPGMFG